MRVNPPPSGGRGFPFGVAAHGGLKELDVGMDLKPIAPATENAPWGLYNIAGWTWLYKHLVAWNRPDLARQMPSVNDGEEISNATCIAIGDTIEANLSKLNEVDRVWITPHIELWRTCGGYEVW